MSNLTSYPRLTIHKGVIILVKQIVSTAGTLRGNFESVLKRGHLLQSDVLYLSSLLYIRLSNA